MDLGKHSFKRQLPKTINKVDAVNKGNTATNEGNTAVKEENKIQSYSIEEVLNKGDDWIILEYEEGKPYIYDISRWIANHPGGNAILRGTKANAYYKNKQAHPKKPIDLFRSQGIHKDNQVIEKYLIQKNNSVRLVGILDQ